MNKATALSVLRLILTAAGAYLIGKDLFGTAINESFWNEIVGVVIALGSTIWGIVDKTATIEMIQSGVRSVLIVVGGLLVASGKIKEEVLTAILGIVAIVLPGIQSATSRKKVEEIKKGALPLVDLKGTKPEVKPPTPNNHT